MLAVMHIFRSPQVPSIVVPCELVKIIEKFFAQKFLEDEKISNDWIHENRSIEKSVAGLQDGRIEARCRPCSLTAPIRGAG